MRGEKKGEVKDGEIKEKGDARGEYEENGKI